MDYSMPVSAIPHFRPYNGVQQNGKEQKSAGHSQKDSGNAYF